MAWCSLTSGTRRRSALRYAVALQTRQRLVHRQHRSEILLFGVCVCVSPCVGCGCVQVRAHFCAADSMFQAEGGDRVGCSSKGQVGVGGAPAQNVANFVGFMPISYRPFCRQMRSRATHIWWLCTKPWLVSSTLCLHRAMVSTHTALGRLFMLAGDGVLLGLL